MIAVAGDARIVYVGEAHDNPASHRLELQVLQGLEELHPGRQALGMEMFPRSQQPIARPLGRRGTGREDLPQGVSLVRNWHMDFDYYRDLLNFARDRKIPVVALNAEKSLVEAMRNKTPDQLNAEQQAQLPELDFTDPYQRAMVTGYLRRPQPWQAAAGRFRPGPDAMGRNHGRIGGGLSGKRGGAKQASDDNRRRQPRQLWLRHPASRLSAAACLLRADRRS